MKCSGKKSWSSIKCETHLSFNSPKFSLFDFKFISTVYITLEKVFNSTLDLYNNICSKSTRNIHIQHIICSYTIPIKIKGKCIILIFKMVELWHKINKSLPQISHTHTHTHTNTHILFYNSFLLFNSFIILDSQCKIIIMKCMPTKGIRYNFNYKL